MAKSYRWVFQVVDRISAPVRRMQAALGAAQNRVEKLIKSVQQLESMLGKLRKASMGAFTSTADKNLKAMSMRLQMVSRSASRMGAALGNALKGRSFYKSFFSSTAPPNAAKVLGAGPSAVGDESLTGSLFEASLGADLASSAIKGLLGMVVNLGKEMLVTGIAAGKFAIEMFSMKESTLASLKVMLGNEADARGMFAEMLRFAKKTPFETQDVVQGYTAMLGAGFTKDQAGKVFAALGDVASMSGFDKQVISRITLAFSQIKAKGRLQGEEMLQVLEASGRAGVGATAVYEKIAKKLGIATGQVAKAISAGRVDSDTGILAILEAIQDKSGGKVGNLMLQQSTTLKGLISTLASVPGDFLLSMDVSKLKGFTAFKDVVSNLVQVFDTSSVSGQRLMGVLERLFDTVFTGLFGSLSGPQGAKVLEDVVIRISDFIDQYGAFLGTGLAAIRGFVAGFWSVGRYLLVVMGKIYGGMGSKDMRQIFEKLGESLGQLVAGVLLLTTAMGALINPVVRVIGFLSILDETFQKLNDWFSIGMGWGTSLAEGLKQGILTALPGPVAAISSMVSAVQSAYTVPTETHSPSGLFRDYGGWAMEGYAQGVWNKLPMAQQAVGAAGNLGATTLEPQIALTLPEMAAQARSTGGGPTSLTIQEMHVHTNYAPGSPDAVSTLQADMREALTRLLREIRMEMGVQP